MGRVGKVLLRFTGGTIGMKLDPATGAAAPALNGAELLAHDGGLARLAEIEVLEFGLLPGDGKRKIMQSQ